MLAFILPQIFFNKLNHPQINFFFQTKLTDDEIEHYVLPSFNLANDVTSGTFQTGNTSADLVQTSDENQHRVATPSNYLELINSQNQNSVPM